jgi:hypothetical protein
METYVGLKLGPNPSIYAATILERAKDVNFVIGAVLAGKTDRSGVPLAAQIDADEIGVLGYSLGGQTTLATVTGISTQGLPADRRVKAAFMGAGSNYSLLLNASDYANARVPLMFFGNDTGIAYTNFNAFTNSPRKYLVDIAGWNHHVGGYQTSWCQDIHNSMVAVNPAVYPQDCEHVRPHPFDLRSGDQIAFVPAGGSYRIAVRSGAALLNPGTTKLSVGGNGTAILSYAGFSLPVPGTPDPVTTLFVSEDGAITSRTSGDYTGVDDNGTPWYMRGQLLLTNRLTIGALMKDLDSTAATAGGGVFATYDATRKRVIVTYQGVPAAGTTVPNTLQVVIYASGEIDITIGMLASTGPNYAPGILGTLGIASGRTRAVDFRKVKPIDFAASAPVSRGRIRSAFAGSPPRAVHQGAAIRLELKYRGSPVTSVDNQLGRGNPCRSSLSSISAITRPALAPRNSSISQVAPACCTV